jgi:hypothetical protein
MSRITYPSRSLSDRRFVYVSAACTDIRRTWRKFRLLARLQQKACA